MIGKNKLNFGSEIDEQNLDMKCAFKLNLSIYFLYTYGNKFENR